MPPTFKLNSPFILGWNGHSTVDTRWLKYIDDTRGKKEHEYFFTQSGNVHIHQPRRNGEQGELSEEDSAWLKDRKSLHSYHMWFYKRSLPFVFQFNVSSASFSWISISCSWLSMSGYSTSRTVHNVLLYQVTIKSKLATNCLKESLEEYNSAAVSGIFPIWSSPR